MKWRNRLTNYNFWISIVSAVLLILQAFEFQFDIAYINEIATAVLGLLVVIGIISDPTKAYSKEETLKAQNIETPAVKEEEKETIKLPIEDKTETNSNSDENDFKTVITQISNDIDEKLSKLNELQNLIISDINSKAQFLNKSTEEVAIQPAEEQKPAISNIVNN